MTGIDAMLRAAGVDPATVESSTPLGDATYNTAYRVRRRDGTGLVLKVAPDPARPALTYERDIMRTEELFYRTAAGAVPAPAVLHADYTRRYGSDFLVITELPGANWWSQRAALAAERARLRTGLGTVVAALHRVTGPGFGYPQRGLTGDWRSAFTGMTDLLLADARRFDAPLPVERVGHAFAANAGVLDDVAEPVLVHFDLWEGNVLVDNGRITGLVDGERAFWGDPLAEMASVSLFGDVEADPAFLSGYRAAGGRITFDRSTRARLALYRLYLYTIMLVEGVPRGRSAVDLVTPHLLAALEALAGR